jgi:hypothetical protein|tara:strand:- start:2062 stop:2562 length:501 start_codon:yes stop_codon:yes gene_type:complete
MITFNYISLLILLFSLLQNFNEIYKFNYLFSILYSSTILIFLLIKKYKKIYKISNNIIIYTAIIIPNIYLFFYKNIKEGYTMDDANKDATKEVDDLFSDVKEEPNEKDDGCLEEGEDESEGEEGGEGQGEEGQGEAVECNTKGISDTDMNSKVNMLEDSLLKGPVQ